MTTNIDWFVAPTGARGDGSREHPFHDPWVAFRRAEPGDTIHIATGIYYGRFDRSSWIIETPQLTVLGGYSREFSTRAPWETPSIFACYPSYEHARESTLVGGRDNHSGLILDGVCLDAAGRNEYASKAPHGIGKLPAMDGVMASFSSPNVTIRNCVFANSANGGVEISGTGSRFENNLLINMIGLSMLTLRNSTTPIEQPLVVSGNTFCFMHDLGEPAGKGGDRSQGVRVQTPTVIENNVFLSIGNSAIGALLDVERIVIERNIFFASTHNLITCNTVAFKGEIKEKNLEELEDIGFKAYADNVVQDPAIKGWRVEWLDAVTRDLWARYATPPREASNALRTAMGLVALAPPDVRENGQKGATSPRFDMGDIANFVSGVKQGFHVIDTPVTLTMRMPEPESEYQRIDYAMLVTPDATLANTRVELQVGLGMEQNIQLLTDAPVQTHMGVRIYNPGTDDNSLYVLIPRFSFASKQYREGRTYQRGIEVEKTYWLRGVYRTDTNNNRQKATLLVEAVRPAPMHTPAWPARPVGRDWFVRAGASGGDGSREKPFRDLFQALEKCEGGDTIHVAGGEYFGKLRAGKWLLSMRHLALLGGYNEDFTLRDPWANHTRFLLDADEKAKSRPSGTILASKENSDGLVLDGFIFDGATWNNYKDGSLDLATSPLAPLINLRGNETPITVRNCLVINGSENGIQIDASLLVFENNVIVNISGDALVINANGAGPAIIRNNTILFASDPTSRAGTGQSSSRGTLMQLKGRGCFILEANIIGFADNYGIRAALPQDSITLQHNVFGANLFNHLCDCQYLFADGSNWARRVEADSLYQIKDNTLTVDAWPIDSVFLDVALTRLFTLPSCIDTEEWKSIALTLGAGVLPAEEKPADTAAVPPSSAEPPSGSLSDLMAKLGDTMNKLKQAEAANAPPPEAPKYCPRYDWQKALALFIEGEDSTPGAHRKILAMPVFSVPSKKPIVEYRTLNAAEIDTLRETLHQQSISLRITQMRDASANSSVFAPGTDRTNYRAYAVQTVDTPTRTRITILVRADTEVSRRIDRVQSSDALTVHGTAHLTSGTSGLSIVIDAFEMSKSS